MGIYTEYINRKFDLEGLNQERKSQLKRISQIRRGRDILVFASDLNKQAPISISHADTYPIFDQLENLSGDSIDVVLETPGGYGEVVEDIVKIIRDKYEHVGFIIPGWAKSAGTIMAMAGDEILMDKSSALGPIDAQITFRGQTFSAHALLEGLNKIREDVLKTGKLNPADYPILQNITPGDIQSAENALSFSQKLVTDWLTKYKFKFWDTHSSTGAPVTQQEKELRAAEIAAKLSDHGHWLTHGRSIKIEDLEEMRLKIYNYENDPDLYDAIKRYYILLKMYFDRTDTFKVYETPGAQIYRNAQNPNKLAVPKLDTPSVEVEFNCGQCNNISKIQINLKENIPLKDGFLPYPKDDVFVCPHCKAPSDISAIKQQIESTFGAKVVV